jgi:hypothetical protein
MIKEQEWKRVYTSSHSASLADQSVHLYKVYGCLKNKLVCIKAITDHQGLGKVVNIKIHTSNGSLSVAQEDLPLHELSTPNN